ncbi:lasso peptide biosynthesis B2 protein [Streptomyces sp. NPDC092307]|uniref:lasso peptide biosynthesis B2 protein n=1 Tax=Streptomyces sp. NPDC092307 TaxID=3366013 RepID=UPI00382D1EA9
MTSRQDRPRLPYRMAALAAVGAARLLAGRSPHRIKHVLLALRHGAAPATPKQAESARHAVTMVSPRCAGEYCVQRSLATTLLCRLLGTWPTWCVGVRTAPFTAHAWVEADGRPVGEPHAPGDYRLILAVPAKPELPLAAMPT